jgi:endo-1,4-beta-xylanase
MRSFAGLLFLAWAVVDSSANEESRPETLKEAFKEHFLVGVAINRSHATGQSTGKRTLEQIGQELALIQTHFNQITAENDMKWERIQPQEGPEGYDFGPADAFVDFGEKHGHELVGHTLVWHNQTPDWVFAGKVPPPQSTLPMGGIEPGQMKPAYAGPRATREELLERMRDHIHKVVGRYKGRVKTWDVANEALAEGNVENDLRDSLWLQIIGPDFIAKAFQYAHEADPDAILRYNDYGLEKPAKAQRLIRLIKSLQEQKVPIHAIGTQAHLNLDTAGFDQFDRSLAEIAKLGLPIHVTELDIHGGDKGDQKLALAYEGVFRAIMKHRDYVKMVTFWGGNDAVSWLRDGSPLLFDGDCRPKAAFDAVIRVAHEAPPASHDLTPLHDATRVLENPHKGWYHHFPDNHPNKYQIARDEDLLDFPGMDHLYIRLAWAYLEPKEGQFDWSVIDRIIDKWTGKGLGIALRISCKETSTDRIEQQYATPLWVKHAGAKGGHYKMGNPVGPEAPWEPVYGDPVFLEKLEKFLSAYAARYDGKPWVRYVDIGSIGDWGEGHSWASSRKVLSFAVRKTHIDLHLKYFKRSQLMISEDYVHALKDPAEREILHRYILDHGISYRDDSILVDGNFSGSGKTFTVRSPEYFAAAYPLRPTVLELEHYGKVKSLGNWDASPDSAAFKSGEGRSGADHLRGALGLLGATYIGYHGDAREWLTDNPELTNELLNRCGYWLFPQKLDIPSAMVAGSSAPLQLTIENRGVAPPYHPYELRLKLAQGDTLREVAIGNSDRTWLPGEPIRVQSQLILPKDFQPGRYTVSIGLFEGARPVEFALKSSRRDRDGFYRVAEITVEAGK